jgi:hypothetical protein
MMTTRTTQAINQLGEKLREYCWGLYDGKVRQEAIEESDEDPALLLCPLATTGTHLAASRVLELAGEPGSDLRNRIDRERPEMLRHLRAEQPDTDERWLEDSAIVYAAAAIIHETPQDGVKSGQLELPKSVADDVMAAADDTDTATGRRLVQALASEHNLLREEHEAVYGRLTEVGTSQPEHAG